MNKFIQITARLCATCEVLLHRRTGLERESGASHADARPYLLAHGHTREGILTCVHMCVARCLYCKGTWTLAEVPFARNLNAVSRSHNGPWIIPGSSTLYNIICIFLTRLLTFILYIFLHISFYIQQISIFNELIFV